MLDESELQMRLRLR
jgi:hypothetical protein